MSSNYPCLSMEDNVVKYNEPQKSNLANLLNMYCLDSDNIQKMAPKPGIQEYLWPFPFHYLSVFACSEVWWWSWYPRHSPL